MHYENHLEAGPGLFIEGYQRSGLKTLYRSSAIPWQPLARFLEVYNDRHPEGKALNSKLKQLLCGYQKTI